MRGINAVGKLEIVGRSIVLAKMKIDYAINDKCWNMYDSYGEICVGCGCCSKDKAVRQKARYEFCKRRIEDAESFDDWFDDDRLRAIQEKNVKSTLKYYRRLLRYYQKKVSKKHEI